MFKLKFLLATVILTFSLLVACSSDKTDTPEQKALDTVNESADVFSINSVEMPEVGKMVDFSYTNNVGEVVSIKQLTQGKVVFINFWGTWCPPCRKEIPDIISITEDLKDKNFVTIGIALERDQQNPIKTVSDFVNSNSINYYNFIGNGEIVNAYGGVEAVPTTYIIDANGMIVEKIVGARSKSDFMNSINKAFQTES
jgi:thiol-disulfide isomerase/thioredoxin